MADRSPDWLQQARRNLQQANASAREGLHEWSCFAAQQAAEAAARALHLRVGQFAWGQVVRRLLEELPGSIRVPPELIESARILDVYFLPTRYPDNHSAGAPGEHYGPRQSREAIEHACAIVAYCEAEMARSVTGDASSSLSDPFVASVPMALTSEVPVD